MSSRSRSASCPNRHARTNGLRRPHHDVVSCVCCAIVRMWERPRFVAQLVVAAAERGAVATAVLVDATACKLIYCSVLRPLVSVCITVQLEFSIPRHLTELSTHVETSVAALCLHKTVHHCSLQVLQNAWRELSYTVSLTTKISETHGKLFHQSV